MKLFDKLFPPSKKRFAKAVEAGHLEEINIVLQRRPRMLNIPGVAPQVLGLAAEMGHASVVDYLLATVDDVDYVDSTCEGCKETPLFKAARRGHKDVVALLLDKGADANCTDGTTETALYVAAANGHEDVVALLLSKGVDVNPVNYNGETALYAASKESHKSVAKLLRENGGEELGYEEYCEWLKATYDLVDGGSPMFGMRLPSGFGVVDIQRKQSVSDFMLKLPYQGRQRVAKEYGEWLKMRTSSASPTNRRKRSRRK